MTKQEKFIEGARRRLEEKALEYARMKTLGVYIDGETVGKVCFSDQEWHTESLLKALGLAAVELLTEMTLVPLPERAAENEDV